MDLLLCDEVPVQNDGVRRYLTVKLNAFEFEVTLVSATGYIGASFTPIGINAYVTFDPNNMAPSASVRNVGPDSLLSMLLIAHIFRVLTL